MNNTSTEVIEKLESFYSNETFFKGLLHETCKYTKECWKGRSDNVKKESKWNYFSLPYIGKEYRSELVCVGLNVHEGGGRNLQEMQIRGINVFKTDKEPHENDKYGYKYDPGVIESLKTKRKPRVFFEKGMEEAVKRGDLDKVYGGTDLWHRIAVYSTILLEGYSPDVADNFEKLSETYERIIYMDAIKCSPARNKSKPTKIMEDRCPDYIFFEELKIIKPDKILIMSKPVARLMKEKYMHGSSGDFPRKGKDIDHCQIKIEEKNIDVYYIVHPGYIGRGTRTELFQELGNSIK